MKNKSKFLFRSTTIFVVKRAKMVVEVRFLGFFLVI